MDDWLTERVCYSSKSTDGAARRQQQRIEGNIIIIFATETARFSRVPATSIYRWDGGRFENLEKESRVVIVGHLLIQDVWALIRGHQSFDETGYAPDSVKI